MNTQLHPAEPSETTPGRSAFSFQRDRVLWILPAIIIVSDQITKWLIRASLDLHESVEILGDWLRFTSIRNPGGAFGLRWGHDSVYYISAAIIVGWIIYQLVRFGHTRRLSIYALALILGGAIGNLIDRVAFGEVTDFIDAEFFDMVVPAFNFGIINHPGYELQRWPAFNIADAAVTVGLIALLVSLIRDPRIGRRPTDDETTPVVPPPHTNAIDSPPA